MTTAQTTPADTDGRKLITQNAIEQFLYREARYLDDREFEKWLDCYADDVVIWDETFIPDNQLQVEDRAHRVSRPDHQVSIWYLRTRDSIEEAIAATTGGRQAVLDTILDKSRGVDVRKRIKEYIPKSKVSSNG